jgi:stress response protein YsnF
MNKKLTQEEIENLTNLKLKYRDLIEVIGNTEIQIMNLEFRKEQFKVNLKEIQEEEIRLGKELEEKYGNGTISLENGEFSPNE